MSPNTLEAHFGFSETCVGPSLHEPLVSGASFCLFLQNVYLQEQKAECRGSGETQNDPPCIFFMDLTTVLGDQSLYWKYSSAVS